MTREEAKSCIGTIEMLQRLAYNVHGIMDVIDANNCKKIIKTLEQEPVLKIRTEIEKGNRMENYINAWINQLEETGADSITQIYDVNKNGKKYHISIYVQEATSEEEASEDSEEKE